MESKKRKRSKVLSTSREPLQSYLNEIATIPLLTIEEERALGYRAQCGEEVAIQTLVASNLRFVVKVAKKYRAYGVPFLDLINEGNLGLMQAAKRFDPTRNIRFISYAVWWIRQSMLDLLSRMGHPVRLPVKVHNLLYKIGITTSVLTSDGQEKPTIQAVADGIGFSVEDVTNILKMNGEPVSLDQPLKNSELKFQSILPDINGANVYKGLMQESMQHDLKEVLSGLREKERQVLSLRFGLNHQKCHTLKVIGEMIGVSRERVRQIQEKALAKLRNNSKARTLFHDSLAGAA
jgi:RNA polymerase primary sigma factor